VGSQHETVLQQSGETVMDRKEAAHRDHPECGLVIDSVRKELGGRAVLKEASLSLRSGEVCLLQGPNGSGKSTLLACVAGLHVLDSGRIRVGDPPADPLGVEAKRWIGYAPDVHPIDLRLSVGEYLYLLGALHGLDRLEERIQALANPLGTAELASVPLEHCSRGMTKRATLVAALLHDPPLLILDEPEAGLDSKAQGALLHILQQRASAGVTMLIATHHPTFYATLAPRAILLAEGAVQESQEDREGWGRP
jgi:ABC-type multidrug transport system ATPase subunit